MRRFAPAPASCDTDSVALGAASGRSGQLTRGSRCSLNTLLVQMGAVEAPINFFGVRTVQIQIFGLSIPFPLALSMVIAFEAWRYFPLSFLFILARMQSIPQDMYEAADMDGASPFQ